MKEESPETMKVFLINGPMGVGKTAAGKRTICLPPCGEFLPYEFPGGFVVWELADAGILEVDRDYAIFADAVSQQLSAEKFKERCLAGTADARHDLDDVLVLPRIKPVDVVRPRNFRCCNHKNVYSLKVFASMIAFSGGGVKGTFRCMAGGVARGGRPAWCDFKEAA